MAQYSKLVITNDGQALMAKMIAGSGSIDFTKMCTSSAQHQESELQDLSALDSIEQTALISKVSQTNDVAIKVEAAFSNVDLTDGYYMRTLGLYAVDPEKGEILYAVCIETTNSCYMPPYNGVTVSTAYIQAYTTVGNAENVSLEVDPGAFVTIRDMRALEDMVANKLSGIATGTCVTARDTPAKAVDCPDFALRDGARVMVTFSNGSSTNYMTLNVNDTGAFTTWFPLGQTRVYNNEAISKLIAAGCAYEFIFQEDGSNSKWVYCGVVSTAESLGALPLSYKSSFMYNGDMFAPSALLAVMYISQLHDLSLAEMARLEVAAHLFNFDTDGESCNVLLDDYRDRSITVHVIGLGEGNGGVTMTPDVGDALYVDMAGISYIRVKSFEINTQFPNCDSCTITIKRGGHILLILEYNPPF